MEKLSWAWAGEGQGGCGSQRLHRSCTEAPRLGGGESRPYLFMIRLLAFALVLFAGVTSGRPSRGPGPQQMLHDYL